MTINYQKKMEDILNNIKNNGPQQRPSLLIHSCCAPCSSYILKYLIEYFNITVFYYNPNIYPVSEHDKRLNEQKELINQINSEKKNKFNFIKLIEGPSDFEKFSQISKELENEPEGGKRCCHCYLMRLEKTAEMAKENNYDYFTTTLTISPHKNASVINNIGQKLEAKYSIKYLYSNFKKKDGYKKSIQLSKQYNLYRQDYCGCVFSKNLKNNFVQ